MRMLKCAWIAAAAAVLVGGGLAACARQTRSSLPARSEEPGNVSSYSVYDLGSSWADQRGDTVTLHSLVGKPVVLGLIYTRCASTCPLIVEAMRRMEAQAADARLVLVSLDPSHDDAERLATYARVHELDERWTLLSGDADGVQELTALLGARYRRVSATEIAHTNTITVLDANGRIVGQQPSWDTQSALAAVAAARH